MKHIAILAFALAACGEPVQPPDEAPAVMGASDLDKCGLDFTCMSDQDAAKARLEALKARADALKNGTAQHAMPGLARMDDWQVGRAIFDAVTDAQAAHFDPKGGVDYIAAESAALAALKAKGIAIN